MTTWVRDHVGRDVLAHPKLQVEERTDHPAVERLDLHALHLLAGHPLGHGLPPELAGVGADPALQIQQIALLATGGTPLQALGLDKREDLRVEHGPGGPLNGRSRLWRLLGGRRTRQGEHGHGVRKRHVLHERSPS